MILLKDDLPGALPIGQMSFKTVSGPVRKSTSPGLPYERFSLLGLVNDFARGSVAWTLTYRASKL